MTRKRGSEREEAARELELYRTGKWAFEGTPEETAEHFAALELLAREGSTEPPPMSFDQARRIAATADNPEDLARRTEKIGRACAAAGVLEDDLHTMYKVLNGYHRYRAGWTHEAEDPQEWLDRAAGLYVPKKRRGPYKPKAKVLDWIEQADNILIDYYVGHGMRLTLRQLYYKMVTKNILPNNADTYDDLGAVMKDARYWGMISWDMLIDRGRTVMEFETYDDGAAALDHLGETFMVDMWADQPTRVEVWVEKDAAIGTIEAVCKKYQVPWASTRGYHSTSGAKAAAERMLGFMKSQDVLVLHIADLDPSGWDMTRDIDNRLNEFILPDMDRYDVQGNLEIRRIALNMDQVHTLVPRGKDGHPLSQEVKDTDSRAKAFTEEFHSRKCWELDAIEPTDLADIIEQPVLAVRDVDRWNASVDRMDEAREGFVQASRNWSNGRAAWGRN